MRNDVNARKLSILSYRTPRCGKFDGTNDFALKGAARRKGEPGGLFRELATTTSLPPFPSLLGPLPPLPAMFSFFPRVVSQASTSARSFSTSSILCSTKKGGGSSKNNRASNPKYLGPKVYNGTSLQLLSCHMDAH